VPVSKHHPGHHQTVTIQKFASGGKSLGSTERAWIRRDDAQRNPAEASTLLQARKSNAMWNTLHTLQQQHQHHLLAEQRAVYACLPSCLPRVQLLRCSDSKKITCAACYARTRGSSQLDVPRVAALIYLRSIAAGRAEGGADANGACATASSDPLGPTFSQPAFSRLSSLASSSFSLRRLCRRRERK
jgi:hypothetical protein